MLKKLVIQRFKSIQEQTIEFGAVNLLIGPNGSGKSNLLEALGILAAALSSGLEANTLDLKGVRLSLPHLFKSAFKNQALPQSFRLEATFENGTYTCGIRSNPQSHHLEFATEVLYDGNTQVFGRSGHGIKLHSVASEIPHFSKDLVPSTRSVWSVIQPIVTISPELRHELEEFAKFAIYAPQTAIMRGMAVDQRIVEPLGLTGSGLANAVLSIERADPHRFNRLMQVIWEPGWANEVRVDPYDPQVVPTQVKADGLILYIRDRFMHTERNMLSAFDASEGTLYLIFVSILLAHQTTPNVFALDNVDGTLNPRLVRKLSKHLIDNVLDTESSVKQQVFMTSHHPSSLDSFDIFDDMQRIFVCRRNTEKSGGVIGRSLIERLEPPVEMSKNDWMMHHDGKNLSELLLTERIAGAL